VAKMHKLLTRIENERLLVYIDPKKKDPIFPGAPPVEDEGSGNWMDVCPVTELMMYHDDPGSSGVMAGNAAYNGWVCLDEKDQVVSSVQALGTYNTETGYWQSNEQISPHFGLAPTAFIYYEMLLNVPDPYSINYPAAIQTAEEWLRWHYLLLITIVGNPPEKYRSIIRLNGLYWQYFVWADSTKNSGGITTEPIHMTEKEVRHKYKLAEEVDVQTFGFFTQAARQYREWKATFMFGENWLSKPMTENKWKPSDYYSRSWHIHMNRIAEMEGH
jgi:hypothetical protein